MKKLKSRHCIKIVCESCIFVKKKLMHQVNLFNIYTQQIKVNFNTNYGSINWNGQKNKWWFNWLLGQLYSCYLIDEILHNELFLKDTVGVLKLEMIFADILGEKWRAFWNRRGQIKIIPKWINNIGYRMEMKSLLISRLNQQKYKNNRIGKKYDILKRYEWIFVGQVASCRNSKKLNQRNWIVSQLDKELILDMGENFMLIFIKVGKIKIIRQWI